jgi:hypothetical protein
MKCQSNQQARTENHRPSGLWEQWSIGQRGLRAGGQEGGRQRGTTLHSDGPAGQRDGDRANRDGQHFGFLAASSIANVYVTFPIWRRTPTTSKSKCSKCSSGSSIDTHSHTQSHTVTHSHTQSHTHTHTRTHMSMSMCMCMCKCMPCTCMLLCVMRVTEHRPSIS